MMLLIFLRAWPKHVLDAHKEALAQKYQEGMDEEEENILPLSSPHLASTLICMHHLACKGCIPRQPVFIVLKCHFHCYLQGHAAC